MNHKSMVAQHDLGLSLSLGFSESHRNATATATATAASLHLNLFPTLLSTSSSSLPYSFPQKSPGNDNFSSSDRSSETCRVEIRPLLKGIDVNRSPTVVDVEEEAGVSSPNSTISSVSGKRSEREPNGDDHDVERASSRGISDEDDCDTSRKKLRLSKDQSAVLEESFKDHNTLNPKQKSALAKRLGLRPRQVEVWFQNRRARTKLKQTEVDCEYLKRCCETFKEENRRLQKEVQELRALKLSPQFYMQMTPPTTLTMCPSCERVAAPPSAAAASATPPVVVDTRSKQTAGGGGSCAAHPRPIPFNLWATPTTSASPLQPRTQ